MESDRRRRRLPSSWRQRRPWTTTTASWTSAAGQRVSRKYRRSRFDVGRLQRREFDKLRRIVPSLSATDTANQRRVSKVKVVEETIRYIDQLHRMLAKRVQADDVYDKEVVADAAKNAFIRSNQYAAEGGDVTLGNGRHDNRTTADTMHTASCKTVASSSKTSSDNSACSADR